MEKIAENILQVKENIERAAQKSGRNASDITLIGVSKTVSVEHIQKAITLGITNFGENKVQELLSKYEVVTDDPTWHMIGHLQTNKVKYIVDKVKLIHSVDSIKLAQVIDKRAKQHHIVSDILIEINVADEQTKHGISIKNAHELIEQMNNLTNVKTKGLMCIAPFVENQEENRVYFEKMYRLFVDIKAKRLHNIEMRFLSMGMTGDYQVAIEEGANMVRIGTGIFGCR